MEDELKIYAIEVLQDNIVWICANENTCFVIDPSVSEPIRDWISNRNLDLVGILQTHHHLDHIGGTEELLQYWPNAEVVASKKDLKKIPFQTISVENNDEICFSNIYIKVLNLPGHTNNHIGFFINKCNKIKTPLLFSGDVIFGGGCGRIFEGEPNFLYESLRKIKNLPNETLIYCAHEYTQANLTWANYLLPNDLKIEQRLKEVINHRKQGKLTIPLLLKEELEVNLFLRVNSLEDFIKYRKHKDNW